MEFELMTLLPAAFVAGLLMFLAPCTLPLVPGYLAYIAGGSNPVKASGESHGAGGNKRGVVRNAVAFVVGFSVIFMLLGAFAATLGVLVAMWKLIIIKVAGLAIIVLGLSMLDLVLPRFVIKERHIALPSSFARWFPRGRLLTSFILGTLFALGWSPCIGPILATVLFVAAVNPGTGVLLLGVFSLGMGLPFILSAVFIEQLSSRLTKWGGFATRANQVGAVFMIAIGLLMFFNQMGVVTEYGLRVLSYFGINIY